jgi:hypothetical protein
MLDNTILVRLANSWRRQAQVAGGREEAETLQKCADQITSLIRSEAIDAKSFPSKEREPIRREAS